MSTSDLQKKDDLRWEKRLLEDVLYCLEEGDIERTIFLMKRRLEDIQYALED